MRIIYATLVFALSVMPVHAADVHEIVRAAAVRNGVPPKILHGIIMAESGYNCRAYNRRGHAMGIGQVKPRTARSVGVRGNLFNCKVGAEAAARYARRIIARAGAGCAGLSLYERGIWARPRCTAYGRKVLRYSRR